MVYAYSFDHPIMTSSMIEAARRGVDVVLYMDAKYLLGEHMSRHGTRLLADALGDAARAPGQGGLRVFTVKGRDATTVYERYDRRVSPDIMGACHAKVL